MGQFLEYVKMALDNIRCNKGRSVLTMLGIIIGITSVVTIVSVGNGVKKDVIDSDNEQGNTVTIRADMKNTSNPHSITMDDIAFLKTSFNDSAKSVSSAVSESGTVTTRRGKFDADLTLTTPGYENAQFTKPLIAGNYFTDHDVENANMVCVINEHTALQLFGNTDILGMSIELQVDGSIQNLIITGIRETPSDTIDDETDMELSNSISIEMPYTVSTAFGSPVGAFSSVDITAYKKDQVSGIAKTTVQLLNARHQNLGDKPFIQQKPLDFGNTFRKLLDGVTAFVALVAGISLLVGGIGVMNIMLVSVTERTREIGIRKALGAKTGSIIAQFLCESAIISGLGGVIGILLSAGFIGLITALNIGGIKASLSLPSIIIATLFSCSVGIIFGIYPARKAAKLSPIQALRRL